MQLLGRFWRDYVRRYRGWYLLGVVSLLATNALAVLIPRLTQWAVDALAAGEGAAAAWPFALGVVLSGASIIFVRTFSRTLFFNPGRMVEYRIKSRLFEHLTRLPRSFLERSTAGDLVSRGTNDANGVRSLIGFGALQLFNVIFTLLLTLSMMLYTQPILTLWCVLPLALAMWALRQGVARMFFFQRQLLVELGHLSQRVLESYGGVAVLQAFAAQPGAQRRFDDVNDRVLDLSTNLLWVRTWLLPVVGVTGNLCVAAVLYVGGRQVIDGELSLGALAAFLGYLNILVAGLVSLGWLVGAVQHGYLSLGRMYEVLSEPDARAQSQAALPEAAPKGRHIRVQDLTFTHPGAQIPALRDLNFEVRPGEILGIFGLTGAGKSALLDVLARVYEPPEGTVFLDGEDLTRFDPRAYWRAVCLVSQQPFLFSTSVAQNVALGDEAPDAARIERAVAEAALAADVQTFPDGLLTQVGERGITVSGGQRQRIALARAFYRDFDVLLLDDVMSAVDHATEAKLIEALYRRARGRTTVIVSHRISVLERADRVLVLDEGRLVKSGTHAELAAEPGAYRKAWQIQHSAQRTAAEERARAEEGAQPAEEAPRPTEEPPQIAHSAPLAPEDGR